MHDTAQGAPEAELPGSSTPQPPRPRPRFTLNAAALALSLTAYAGASGLVAGCDPYDHFEDETLSLGAVDPVNFPAANLGEDGDRLTPGVGSFFERSAWQGGTPVGYFAYPVPATLRVDMASGRPVLPATTPAAYSFAAPCTPPAGWVRSERNDDIDYTAQGAVFTRLPAATYTPGVASASSYLPVVAELPVTAPGRTCQEFKTSARIDRVLGAPPPPSGRYLAWLIIDPAASVYSLEYQNATAEEQMTMLTGLGVQRWGWFDRYLLAFIDGGEVPTTPAGTTTLMTTQRIYLPRTPVMVDMEAVEAELGSGVEVLSARRGEAGYSPLCEVWTYSVGDMPVAPEALPRNATEIEQMAAMTLMPGSPRFVFCLQRGSP